MSTPKPARKAPKARVATYSCVPFSKQHDVTVRFRTAAQARAFCKVHNMTQEERRVMLIRSIAYHDKTGFADTWQLSAIADCVTAALHFPSGLEGEK